MASSPIISWQIEEEMVEAVTDFLFLGSKITADGGCSHEIRRWLSLQKKAIINLDSVLKSRHHFADKGSYSQSYVFFFFFSSSQVWMWELDHKEGWALKNWCFQIVVLEKTLKSPLDCKEIKPVNSKKINPEYSWEGLLLKLKLQYFGHLMGRTDSLEKTLVLGKTEGRKKGDDKGWDRWMASLTQQKWVWAGSRSWWWTRKPGVLQSMGSQRVGHDWAT